MRTREVDIFEQREKEQAVKLEKEKKKAKIVGITKIKLDAYVALKIIKHCREEKRASSGMLLGLVKETYLQITNSLPSFQVAPEVKNSNFYIFSRKKMLDLKFWNLLQEFLQILQMSDGIKAVPSLIL
jgi:hypothetical protein